MYTVWIKTVYTGDVKSYGLKRNVKLASSYEFYLYVDTYGEDSYVEVSIADEYYGTYDYSDSELYLILPPNTKVTLGAFPGEYDWFDFKDFRPASSLVTQLVHLFYLNITSLFSYKTRKFRFKK